MQNTHETMVIRPSWSNKKRNTIVTALFIAVVSFIIGAYYYGYDKGITNVEGHALLIAELRDRIDTLKTDKRELEREVARLERSEAVQKAAYKELEKTYEQVDQKNEYLNRRTNFYRSILSPKDGISGVRIHAVKLLQNVSNNSVDFEITLIQSIRHEKNANVEVLVELYTNKNDVASLASLIPSNYSFRHSEVVRGSLQSSQAIEGKLIKITVVPDGNKDKQLVEWHKV